MPRTSSDVEQMRQPIAHSVYAALGGALLFWLLGWVLAENFYSRMGELNNWFWENLWAWRGPLDPAHRPLEGLLKTLVVLVVALVAAVVLIPLLVLSWLSYYAHRLYLFPFIGFLVGFGQVGWLGNLLGLPYRLIAGVGHVTVQSAADAVELRSPKERLLGVLGFFLGAGFLVAIALFLWPMITRGPLPMQGPGETVVRHLPGETWTHTLKDGHWFWRVIEVTTTKDQIEVLLQVQNLTRRQRPLGIFSEGSPRGTYIEAVSSAQGLRPLSTIQAAEGLPINNTTPVAGGAHGIARLRFNNPGDTRYRWKVHLRILDGTRNPPSYDFFLDLRSSP